MKLPSFEKFYEKSRDLLGNPLHEKQPAPDGIGLYQTFERGSIHWLPDVGSHVTRGAIRDAWRKHGWENDILGYPTSEEYPMSILDLRKLNVRNGEENARLLGFGAIELHLRNYQIVEESGTTSIRIGEVETSREWINQLISDYLPPEKRRFKVPSVAKHLL